MLVARDKWIVRIMDRPYTGFHGSSDPGNSLLAAHPDGIPDRTAQRAMIDEQAQPRMRLSVARSIVEIQGPTPGAVSHPSSARSTGN